MSVKWNILHQIKVMNKQNCEYATIIQDRKSLGKKVNVVNVVLLETAITSQEGY